MNSADSRLPRRFSLLQATALNMTNMMGVGPFITIPLLMTGMGGPQALLGWHVALLIVIPDGLVWSELGSAMPGSGGSYVYLREGYGRERWGRLAAFLFIWQFVLSGPLEIASGYIGFANYARYVWPSISREAPACPAMNPPPPSAPRHPRPFPSSSAASVGMSSSASASSSGAY